ncbi:MAG: hypothetical protein OXU61_11365, partial [Gammaproteobacteria bacterium]|nr:hypothetical protein [Gammaproteobacteria bacterium]
DRGADRGRSCGAAPSVASPVATLSPPPSRAIGAIGAAGRCREVTASFIHCLRLARDDIMTPAQGPTALASGRPRPCGRETTGIIWVIENNGNDLDHRVARLRRRLRSCPALDQL